jgi:hypothetical protein
MASSWPSEPDRHVPGLPAPYGFGKTGNISFPLWKQRIYTPKNMNEHESKTDMEAEIRLRWSTREPWVTRDPEFNREWLHPAPLRYYLYQQEGGLWSVCDRWNDIPALKAPAKTRKEAIRRFYREKGRRIPEHTALPEG